MPLPSEKNWCPYCERKMVMLSRPCHAGVRWLCPVCGTRISEDLDPEECKEIEEREPEEKH